MTFRTRAHSAKSIVVLALARAAEKLHALAEEARAATDARASVGRSPIVVVACGNCGAFVLDPVGNACVMCGSSGALAMMVAKLPPGSAIWTDGNVKARTPDKSLAINRPAVK